MIGRPDKLTLDSEKLVPQPGVATSGDGARGALEQFLAIGLPITMNVRNVYVSGGIALVIADWSLKGKVADGSDVDRAVARPMWPVEERTVGSSLLTTPSAPAMQACSRHGLLRREEIGCLTVKITSFPARP